MDRVTKATYKRPSISMKKVRKSMTIPDQSMSIAEIVRRFVRGIPVDVVQRNPVYMDQSEHDFEQIARMDFGDKAAMADDLRDKAEAIKQKAQSDEREKRAKNAKAAAEKAKAKSQKETGIDSLDNTMPDDTGTESQ